MENTETSSEKDTSISKPKMCQIQANENIVKTIEQHIFIRKKCMGDSEVSKHIWANEAIQRKLAKETDLQSFILKSKTFCFYLTPEVEKIIESRVNKIKEFTGSCSRTKWILDAFLEMIEEEREDIRKHQNLTTSSFRN